MRHLTLLPLALAALAATADAQIVRYEGPSPNLTTVLDFDNPLAPAGPIASNSTVFTSVGIASVNLFGTTVVGGDTLTAASNVNGQCLIAQNGVLTVAGPTAPLDNHNAGGGYDIRLASSVDEFQVLFADQINHTYNVELFLGASSLGTGQFAYLNATYPFGPHYWRAVGSQFDRILITFPAGVAGCGIDEFAFGNGPAPVAPSNDECANAQVVVNGANAIDNTNATLSATPFSCLGDGGSDVWFRYVETTARDLQIYTCGAAFDSVLEVYTGTCGSLTSVGCNDDYCNAGSRVLIPNSTPGTVYTIRVGGWRGDTGNALLTIDSYVAPASNCVTTGFGNNNQGNPGGQVFFDLTTSQNVSITGMDFHTQAAVGLPVGVSVYTTPTTYLGNELNMAAWTLAAQDDGTGTSGGPGGVTHVDFVSPIVLAPGTYGIAIVGSNSGTGAQQNLAYTNGTGANQMVVSPDGVLTLNLGAALNVPWTGTPFTPRVFSGTLCYSAGGGPGTNYCMANNNSTGQPGRMGATGTAQLGQNNLGLTAEDLPNNSFAFFLVSRNQNFVMNPGGSQGNLCLGAPIGRYVGPGQIQNSGASGTIALPVNLNSIPQPLGAVAAQVGDTWNFQAWFRDVSGGVPTSNFTDGLSVTIQ